MRLIDADTKIMVLLYNEEREETEYVEMTVADYLDSGTEEGCPQIVSGWVSVKDRLPNEDGLYLAFITPNLAGLPPRIKTAWFMKNLNNNWQFKYEGISGPGFYNGDGEGDWVENVTHWMPLPEPPEEVE